MRRTICLLLTCASIGMAQASNITGAGASFPSPLYGKWAEAYHKQTGLEINYQSIGSSAGVNQIKAKTIDFGATDSPLKDAELKADNLIQFPTVIGGVVPVINLVGVKPGEFTLTGEALGNIYLGKITHWNDPALVALNPELKLPEEKITVVRRADGSGTSFIFTDYLSKTNAKWAKDIGTGNTVNWPTGTGGKGNEGVAAFVSRLKNSIGYVEYAYAKQNNMTYSKMKNAAGNVVAPTADTFSAAVAEVNWSESFAQSLTNQAAKNAWPMTATTFVLVHKISEQPENAQAVLKFFDWAYDKGSDEARNLDYVPLPANLITQIKAMWAKEIKN